VDTHTIRSQSLDSRQIARLEHREIELSRLATLFVVILGVALAAFMYMYVFLVFRGRSWTLNVAFAGFCLLAILFVAYLQLHQKSVRKLRQQVMAELERNAQLRDEPSAGLVTTMPNLAHFWDRLTAEHEMALAGETGLSVMIIEIRSATGESQEDDPTLILDTVATVTRRLRTMDSLYRLSPNVFGLVLPSTDGLCAGAISLRLHGRLDRVRAKHGAEILLATYNYPEDVRQGQQFEGTVKAHLVAQKRSQPLVCVASEESSSSVISTAY
jgi:predicted signal transduction protein with EAL and GGDEF domain